MVKRSHTTTQSYKASSTLTNYMEEKLRLFKLEKELRENGLDLSEREKKKKRANDRMKVHVLNKHVFESMANLTYFFETAARLEFELGEKEADPLFEDEIRELLFGVKDNRFDKYPHVLYRFLRAALSWSFEKDRSNFRLELIHTLQQIVYDHLSNIAIKEFSDDMVNYVISPDVGRVFVWTKLYAGRVEKRNKDELVHRPVHF
ncbi:hypothetical protein BH18THE2_BH18THE2_37410 [soil metagenome]